MSSKTRVVTPLPESEQALAQLTAVAVCIGPRVEAFIVVNEDGETVRTNDYQTVSDFYSALVDSIEDESEESEKPTVEEALTTILLGARETLADEKNERVKVVLITQFVKISHTEFDSIWV